ncbi:hypothetical protein AB0O99_04060 [Cellulosimicrobium funkei]|uniref:hypothetical protein n=1 Tax=Cellulosimicrobium funkei TaxID=264251 RepID=UPI00341DE954
MSSKSNPDDEVGPSRAVSPGASSAMSRFPDISSLFVPYEFPDMFEFFKAVPVPDLSSLYKPYEFPDVSSLYKPYELPDVSELFKAVPVPDLSSLYEPYEFPDVSSLYKPYEFPDMSEFFKAVPIPDISDLFNVARDRVRAYTTAFDERWDELQEAGEHLDLARAGGPGALLAPARRLTPRQWTMLKLAAGAFFVGDGALYAKLESSLGSVASPAELLWWSAGLSFVFTLMIVDFYTRVGPQHDD